MAHKKGTPTWNKGLKMSQEFIETNRRVHTGVKLSEETKKKMSLAHMGNKSNTGRHIPEETKQKMSEAHKGKLSPERVAILQHFWDDPEYHKRQSESHKGLQNSLGFKHDEAFREMIRKRMTNRIVSEDTRNKLSASLKGKPKSPETIEKLRKIRTDPKRFEEWNRKSLKGSHIKPNKQEISLLDLLNTLYPNQYKYVGDGEVMIGGKNPDFINIDGQKKVIEYFGDRWHQGDNPQERIDSFAQYGFACLIIWQSEFKKKPQRVINRIKTFHEQVIK